MTSKDLEKWLKSKFNIVLEEISLILSTSMLSSLYLTFKWIVEYPPYTY